MKRFNNISILSFCLVLGACGDKPSGDIENNQAFASQTEQLQSAKEQGKLCPNGRLNPGESCDDGNSTAGDGCDANCQIEEGYECFYSPSVCHLICSNGHLDDGEQCDDGNLVDGDGCDSHCQLEAGFECDILAVPNTCNTLCGNGYLDEGEECDDGNDDNNDGCSKCHISAGFVCNTDIEPNYCVKQCGNGYLDEGEECDDGNDDNSDGCSECHIRAGFDCYTDVEPTICLPSATIPMGTCENPYILSHEGLKLTGLEALGYLTVNGAKFVIKASMKNGDELSALVKLSTYNKLTLKAGSCDNEANIGPYSGSLIYQATEDDDYYLIIENTSVKNSAPYSLDIRLRTPSCGDGIIDPGEVCDDGNAVAGDGCANCQIEANSRCRTKYAPVPELSLFANKHKTSICEQGVTDWTGHGDSCDNPAVLIGDSGYMQVIDPSEEFTNQHSFNSTCRSSSTSLLGSYEEVVFKVTLEPYQRIMMSNTTHIILKVQEDQCGSNIDCAKLGESITYFNNRDEARTIYIIVEPYYYSSSTVADSIRPLTRDLITFTKDYPGVKGVVCGDGYLDRDAGEQCDDGNTIDNDGCSSTCQLKDTSYWKCSTNEENTSICQPKDKLSVGYTPSSSYYYLNNKICDDDNNVSGDGCYNYHTEPGWSCWYKRDDYYVVPCFKLCGNSELNEDEACDDGNEIDGDGCSKDCRIEEGYECSGTHCQKVVTDDFANNGASCNEAIDLGDTNIVVTLDGFKNGLYRDNTKLDASCTGYNANTTDELKEVFFKVDLKVGEMFKVEFRDDTAKYYTVNYIKSGCNTSSLTCYRPELKENGYFGSSSQTLYVVIERKSTTATDVPAPKVAFLKYYPKCGDGIVEGFEQCDLGENIFDLKNPYGTSGTCANDCTLSLPVAQNKTCAYYESSSYYSARWGCWNNNGIVGNPSFCGGAAYHDGITKDVIIETGDSSTHLVRSSYNPNIWAPDLSTCTKPKNSSNYSFIVRYDLKQGDTLTFTGNSTSCYDTFFIVGDDCWHGECLATITTSGSYTADKDRLVWVVNQRQKCSVAATITYTPAQ